MTSARRSDPFRHTSLLAVIALLAWPTIASAFELSDRLADVRVDEGVVYLDGTPTTPDAFVREIERLQGGRESRGWLFQALDITGPLGAIWVGLGLLGQLLFTGRMVVQWLASERQRRSVVPNAFWWMSFGGATLLLAYFVWRTDIVGVLGQSTGFAIYARNLWLIYRPQHAART